MVLQDGSVLRLREQRPNDGESIRAFLEGLSPESRAFRFLSGGVDLAQAAQLLSRVDGASRVGILALQGNPTRVVGQGIFIRSSPDRAEVAFTVADALHSKGIGAILLGQLAQAAGALGIGMFEANVHPDNIAMLDVFSHSGFAVRVTAEPDLVRLAFPTAMTEEAALAFERREEAAAAAAVRAILNPRSVAVIGAGRHRGTIGGEIFHNLLTGHFQGRLYPVHPEAAEIQSVTAYRRVSEITDEVDLAVVAVPAESVVDVARECADKGVHALVVISAGFAETGPEGARREADLLEVCTSSGMRLVGPNCMGILNTSPQVRLNATFAPAPPEEGSIGFLSQSGAVGVAVIDATRKLGLGLSDFISVGNKADISGNDLLSYWETDPRTEVIALYLESFGNPRKFAQIAERVSKNKPIVVVKSGTGAAGRKAAASHTAALVSESGAGVDALFERAGAIRAHGLGEMFDVVSLLSSQPLPQGDGVAIITNAGGPGILCADACEDSGLTVIELSRASQCQLTELLGTSASVHNPVDLIASATADQYRQAVEIVAADPKVDAIFMIFIPAMGSRAEDVARAFSEAVTQADRHLTIAAVFMADSGITGFVQVEQVRIPVYQYPEDAVRALAGARRLAKLRLRTTSESRPLSGVDPVSVAKLLAQHLTEGTEWLTGSKTEPLLRAYGITGVRSVEVASPEAVARASLELGGRVVLKGCGPGILHKTELGAVVVGLEAGTEVEAAARRMAERLAGTSTPITHFELQTHAPPGVEVLVGATNDPDYGTVVMVGAGGTAVELLHDSAVQLAPIGQSDALGLLRRLKTFPLLDGYRGALKVDLNSLADLVVRLAELAHAHLEIAEIEANPVIASPTGSLAVDVRIRLHEPPALQPVGAKRFHRAAPRDTGHDVLTCAGSVLEAPQLSLTRCFPSAY